MIYDTIWYLIYHTRYLIFETWYLRHYTWEIILVILDIWYSIYNTRYLILCICYLIYDIWYLILDSDNHISYLIFDTLLLKPWYLDPITCYLLLANCYLSFDTYWNMLYYSSYMVLAITCKKIVSFRSCSATGSCFFFLNRSKQKQPWNLPKTLLKFLFS